MITSLFIVFFVCVCVESLNVTSLDESVDAWKQFIGRTNKHELKYCMGWCPQNKYVRNLSPELEEKQKPQTMYEEDNLVSFGQSIAANMFNSKCCHILHNSLHSLDPFSSFKDVSWVTIGTTDRLHVFNTTNQRWPGPKIVLLYFSDYNDRHSKSMNIPKYHEQLLVVKDFADNHFSNTLVLAYVSRRKLDKKSMNSLNTLTITGNDRTTPTLRFPQIPINSLRNVVLDSAPTRFVLPVDLDFVPSVGLYQSLISSIQSISPLNSKAAVVIPQWESVGKTFSSRQSPPSFEQLLESVQQNSARAFSHNEHGIDLHEWVKQTLENEGKGIYLVRNGTKDKANELWEPILMVNRLGLNSDGSLGILPRFLELQTGLTLNKASFTAALQAHRFDFYAIRGEFVFHVPHVSSIYKALSTPWHQKLMGFAMRSFVLEHERASKQKIGNPLLLESFPELGRSKRVPHADVVHPHSSRVDSLVRSQTFMEVSNETLWMILVSLFAVNAVGGVVIARNLMNRPSLSIINNRN